MNSRFFKLALLFIVLNTSLSAKNNMYIKVSDNGHFLKYQNDDPFYYIGDTAWELFHRCSREDVDLYLKDRSSKGFTVIQAAALAELDGLNTPNSYGDRPLIDNNPLKPNEAYWSHVDWVIKQAEKYGMVVGLLPTWGDKVDKAWGVGPVIFNEENSFKYGEWIGDRYKKYPNIIWIIGGDRNSNDITRSTWEGFANGIKRVDKNHLMTFHPLGGCSSSIWFHNSDWLDFNMSQSGHGARYKDNYSLVNNDYNKAPAKPCIDGEPNYEDHAVNWSSQYGWFNEDDVRRACYWSVFAGGVGAVYGAHPLWQMKHQEHEPLGDVRRNWDEALSLVGSSQMQYIHQLMKDRHFELLKPDQSLLNIDISQTNNKILAMRGDNQIVIYQTMGGDFTVNLNDYNNLDLHCYWYNPRNGTYSTPKKIESSEKLKVSAPVGGVDWVFIIEEIN